MPTIVELSEEEIAELMALTNASDPPSAVRSAMIEYIRYARRMQLKTLSGKVQMDLLELRKAKRAEGKKRTIPLEKVKRELELE